MSANVDLVYKWAKNIKEDGFYAMQCLSGQKADIIGAAGKIGQIIGACESIMEATKPIEGSEK